MAAVIRLLRIPGQIGRRRRGRVTGQTGTTGPWPVPAPVAACGADRIEPGVLAGHVLKRIERTLGTQPPHRQVGQAIVWEWQMDGVAQRLTIDFAGGERQLALSMARARGV